MDALKQVSPNLGTYNLTSLKVCNVLLPTGNKCPRWTQYRFLSKGYHETRTPNDSVLNNLITTMYMIIGISHLIYPLLDNLAATDYSIVGMTIFKYRYRYFTNSFNLLRQFCRSRTFWYMLGMNI